MIDKNGIVPFNVGFALEIWLCVIHNMEKGYKYSVLIDAEALELVNDIFEFFKYNSKAFSCTESPSLVFTSDGRKVVVAAI